MPSLIDCGDYVLTRSEDLSPGQVAFLTGGVPALVAALGQDEDEELIFVLLERRLNEKLVRGRSFDVQKGQHYITIAAKGGLSVLAERNFVPASEIKRDEFALRYSETGLVIESILYRGGYENQAVLHHDFSGQDADVQPSEHPVYLRNFQFVWRTGPDTYIGL